MRATRPRYAELSPDQRARHITRSYTAVLIRRGHLDRKPCEVCGASAQAHHVDYDEPRKVRWLCAEHRRQLQRAQDEAQLRADTERFARILASLKSTPP